MGQNNEEENWSESKAVKTLFWELFIRSIFYIAIMVAGMLLLGNFISAGLMRSGRGGGGIIALLILLSCALYVGGLMNRTGCEVNQLILGIMVGVVVSSLILCACAAIMELPWHYFIIIGVTGFGVIAGSMARYKYGDDD